jgi:hypothetical protein
MKLGMDAGAAPRHNGMPLTCSSAIRRPPPGRPTTTPNRS